MIGCLLMKCPLCRKETWWSDANGNENPFRPFCSERCQLIDLGKWASEEYRVADNKDFQETPGIEEYSAENGEPEGGYVN